MTFLTLGVWSMNAIAPSFDRNFAEFLTNDAPDEYWRVETVFSFSNCIDRNYSIMDNVRNLFYPSTTYNSQCSISSWWLLWDMLRVITFAIIFLFIVIAWVKLLVNWGSWDEAKKSAMSMIYIAYWSFLVFWAIWILWYALNIEDLKWTTDLVNNLQSNLFLQILTFFKVLAFFLSIVMMVVSGFKMMAAMDKEEQVKAGKKWAINVIIALVFIKIIDYVFYIAQVSDFAQRASTLVLDIAKILGWILGLTFVLWLFYAWYQMFFSWWDEKAMKKSQSILINIVVASVVLFIFILLIYQIFNEFVG